MGCDSTCPELQASGLSGLMRMLHWVELFASREWQRLSFSPSVCGMAAMHRSAMHVVSRSICASVLQVLACSIMFCCGGPCGLSFSPSCMVSVCGHRYLFSLGCQTGIHGCSVAVRRYGCGTVLHGFACGAKGFEQHVSGCANFVTVSLRAMQSGFQSASHDLL